MERSFANRLTDLRKDSGQSQKDSAAALGVSQALLSHYEKGIRECGLDFVTRAAAHYSVTCDYLLGTSSLKSGFSEDAFSSEDIPEDNKLDALTIFRALMVFKEKLRNQLSPNKELTLEYFALVAYRFLVLSINAGDLPCNWVGEKVPIESDVFLECLCGLENILLDSIKKSPKSVSNSDVPLCVKTLVGEVEKHIVLQIESIFNCLGE